MSRLRPVDCLIDPFGHPMSITLELQALSQIGYRMVIDQIPTSHHGFSRKNFFLQDTNAGPENIPEEPFAEEEFIAYITEAERREMESWE